MQNYHTPSARESLVGAKCYAMEMLKKEWNHTTAFLCYSSSYIYRQTWQVMFSHCQISNLTVLCLYQGFKTEIKDLIRLIESTRALIVLQESHSTVLII